MNNSAGFLHGLGSVFGQLWGCFWDPGPLILSVSCTRDANSQKFVFFYVRVDSFVIFGGFGVVWGVILGAKWQLKWLQNLIKKMSDFWIALGSALVRQRAQWQS